MGITRDVDIGLQPLVLDIMCPPTLSELLHRVWIVVKRNTD